MRKVASAALLALTLIPGSSQANFVYWADWTDSNLFSALGSVGGVSLTFTGTLVAAQPGLTDREGVLTDASSPTTDYWIEGSPVAYTGNAVVDNRPPGSEFLAFNEESDNSLVFGAPVTDPVMAIVSQGRLSLPVVYDFDTPFTVLSEGRGFWGDGAFALGAGDVLTGNELHAVIQFSGTVSQINSTSTEERRHGFTIGLVRDSTVPEPTTLARLGFALAGLGFARRQAR